MDSDTKFWIRNHADERAASNGCRFDIARAAWTIWWIEKYTRLYEGSRAGEPLVLRGKNSMGLRTIQDSWKSGGKDKSLVRIRDYMDAHAAGEAGGWQYEVVARLFGWVKYSDRWSQEIRRFNKGSMFIPKKSGKSPTLAAIGWYLMCGDGEPGMKVFLCAVNGNQARDIAAKHTVEMLKASTALSKGCHLDNARMRITHLASKSMMQPLASGNIRTQKAAEGLNGSALIDEVHVVSTEFMARIVRMGASRKEPFILSFSTAGSDMESYGFHEWEYGSRNNEIGGDENYFFQSYEAPQGLSDSELDANPEKYIGMANPSMGHTVDISELLQDYHASKVTQKTLHQYRQYRLNIWSRTATPWISLDDWKQGDSTEPQPEEETCWGGLEIGYVDEPCAFTLLWPNDHYAIDEAIAGKKPLLELLGALDQPVRSKTWFWLPRGAVEQWRHNFPYDEWEELGLVRIQESGIIDPNGIVADICAIMAKYDVQAIAHSPWKSATVLNRIREQEGYPEERCWEFKDRSPAQWAFPCALFERLIRGSKLDHNANGILDWEMTHATIKPDRLGGVSLVMPERGDRKTVSGIASLIMALDGMAKAPRHYRSEMVVLGNSLPGKPMDKAKTPPRGRLIQEFWEANGRMPMPMEIQEMIETQ